MSRWSDRSDVPRGDDYDDRWRRLEAAGESVHGEADLLCLFEPSSVLDAGCGTGRVAIELDRRGIEAVGVDLDAGMLETARRKAPHMHWIHGDLVDVTVRDSGGGLQRFDIVALPGNVMIFLAPGSEASVVANLARHLRPEGLLVAGFEVTSGRLTLEAYDAACGAAGLALDARWATWDRQPFVDGGGYAVSVHRLAE